MFFQEEVFPFNTTLCLRFPGNISIVSLSHHLFHMFLKWMLNFHTRLYRNIKKNSPRVSRWVTEKLFIDFMCNWQQLCNAWVTGYETWLSLCKKFVLHKVIKKRIEFKDFTEDRKKTSWTIIFIKFVICFLWNVATLLFSSHSGKCLPLILI